MLDNKGRGGRRMTWRLIIAFSAPKDLVRRDPCQDLTPQRPETMNRRLAALFSAVALAASLAAGGCFAAADDAPKPIKVWNLTASAIVDFRLAPGGSSKYGRNFALDDKDKAIDVDERLTLRDVAPGTYDARVKLRNGRGCRVTGLKLEAGEITSIEEKQLEGCLR